MARRDVLISDGESYIALNSERDLEDEKIVRMMIGSIGKKGEPIPGTVVCLTVNQAMILCGTIMKVIHD